MREREADSALNGRIALFLDFDGTLVNLAPTPDAIVVEDETIALLTTVRDVLEGALAIVSGRKLVDLDRWLPPGTFTVVAEHGAIIRRLGTATESLATAADEHAGWLEKARRTARGWPGVLVEEKAFGFAMHYRMAPHFASAVENFARDLIAASATHTVLRAHMAIEIRPIGVTKATGVARLMQESPFRGRAPIFVGDDETDEDGIRAVTDMGGRGYRVGRSFLRDPGDVRRWLVNLAKEGAAHAG